ncbi:hypothetical protein SISNIDRAFT_464604 [Sistotremastrum niveocremeum HHB9708]|uniref:Uncharacterized protein n=1 Tax=Sistotremastrum niveocremeum HHB9708 TaxID=1314777 RepID=A0A164X3R0_9AGAM|nr:hypothetical protein SISNIDRAFT_464604 [Sistotremastrum niveocremeum HHB9708]
MGLTKLNQEFMWLVEPHSISRFTAAWQTQTEVQPSHRNYLHGSNSSVFRTSRHPGYRARLLTRSHKREAPNTSFVNGCSAAAPDHPSGSSTPFNLATISMSFYGTRDGHYVAAIPLTCPISRTRCARFRGRELTKGVAQAEQVIRPGSGKMLLLQSAQKYN